MVFMIVLSKAYPNHCNSMFSAHQLISQSHPDHCRAGLSIPSKHYSYTVYTYTNVYWFYILRIFIWHRFCSKLFGTLVRYSSLHGQGQILLSCRFWAPKLLQSMNCKPCSLQGRRWFFKNWAAVQCHLRFVLRCPHQCVLRRPHLCAPSKELDEDLRWDSMEFITAVKMYWRPCNDRH